MYKNSTVKLTAQTTKNSRTRRAFGLCLIIGLALGLSSCSWQAEWLYRRALDRLAQSEYSAARKDFLRLAQDYPDSPRAAIAQLRGARLLWMQEQQREAAALAYQELVREYSDSPWAATGAVELLDLYSREPDTAMQGLKLARQIEKRWPDSPHHRRVVRLHTEMLMRAQRIPDAIGLLQQQVAESEGADKAKYLYELTHLHYVTGNYALLSSTLPAAVSAVEAYQPEFKPQIQLLQSIIAEERRDIDGALAILYEIENHPSPRVIAERIVALQQRKHAEGLR